ncbi:UBX domain-containing protein 6 [Eumeta japonica]|uniref:UBX domain-containing protein 6 n=1 Tax=Eumeta variegata TaxID=151549 RepID=A0A4C1ZT71_EUMVA|nr:UBX domain-containing protein 6 [Eumeta japonica]
MDTMSPLTGFLSSYCKRIRAVCMNSPGSKNLKLSVADKIKKFFQKKKVDAKFKLAGPGHKLSDSTISYQGSNSSQKVEPMKRSGLSEESKVAAEAALSRLQQKRENPAFNTSLAAIQAQVKKELELEKALDASSECSTRPVPSRVSIEEKDLPQNYAASGVFFKCPLISNDILPRDEWKKNIKRFLYEQLEFERGLTACLIIQSCNNNREKVETCVETLCKYLDNIVSHPGEEKYQKIRMSNRAFTDRVQPIEGAMELLLAAGFEQTSMPNPDGVEEEYLVFDPSKIENNMDTLTTLTDALRTAEPIHLELDRHMQVLLPSQAAVKLQLPPEFYALSPEELKKEQHTKTEAIERSQMLRTKAMREKDELREMKKYKFAIIRIRFPDGILLQGTFSVYERYSEIHEFVQEHLEHDLPFVLNTPTGHKLILEEDANKTLLDLRLVPATILIFSWHPSVVEVINNSPNRDVFLKPEVMIMVQELM